MKKFIAALAVSTALLVTPAAAQENQCGNAKQAQALVDQYKEIPIISWMDPKGTVIMVYANLDTGTATVFAAAGDRYCIVSEGKNVHIGPASSSKPRTPGKDEL